MTEVPWMTKFDYWNNAEIPYFILCNPNKEELFSLGGISERKYFSKFNAISEISFRADKRINEIDMEYYDYIEQRRLVLVENIGYFIIDEIEETDDGIQKYKTVTGKSLESELISKKLVVYISGNESFPVPVSLDELMTEITGCYIPHWTYEIIESASSPIFSGSGKSRSHDVTDITLYDFLINNIEQAYGCVISFDTSANKIYLYDPSLVIQPTNIFFSHDNLIQSATINTITDQLATCLYVMGSGDMGINYVNPLGNNYIYDFDYYKNEYWMSASLVYALDNWELQYNTLSPIYSDDVVEFFDWTEWISGSTSACTVISACMVYVKQQADAALEAGDDALYEELMAQWNDLYEQTVEIVEDIDSGTATRGIIYDEMRSISGSLAFENAMSPELYLQLQPFIIESSYINENIIKTDNMSASSIEEYQYSLYYQALGVLKKMSTPQYTFDITNVNFMKIYDYQDDMIRNIRLGSQVTIEIPKGEYLYPIVLAMDINFDDPEDFKITFGNRLRLDDEAFQFNDLMNKALYAGNTMKIYYQDFKNWSNQYKNQVVNFINSPITTQNNIIYNNPDGEITMDAAGITAKSKNVDGTYSACQIMISKNAINATTDNWATYTKLIGYIASASGYGINTAALIGDITIGSVPAENVLSGSLRFVNLTGSSGSIIVENPNAFLIKSITGYDIQLTSPGSAIRFSSDYLVWNNKSLLAEGDNIFTGSITTTGSIYTPKIYAELNTGGSLIIAGSARITGSIITQDEVRASDTIRTETGFYAGTVLATVPDAGDIWLNKDVRATGGIYLGSIAIDPPSGEVWAANDGRIGGGLYVGTTSIDPTDGDIIATGSIRASACVTGLNIVASGSIFSPFYGGGSMLLSGSIRSYHLQTTGSIISGSDIKLTGGLSVGSIGIFPSAGDIVATADGRLGGGLYVGNTTTNPGAGDIISTNDGRIGGGLYVGTTAIDPQDGNITATGSIIASACITGLNIIASGSIYAGGSISGKDIVATGTLSAPVLDIDLYTGGSIMLSGSIRGSFIQISGSISAGNDIKTTGGIYSGVATIDPGAGVIIAGNDLVAGGGVYAGNTGGAPATGDIIATNDARLGGGLYVGATGIDPSDGNITATGSIIASACVTGLNMIASGSIYAGGLISSLNSDADLYTGGSIMLSGSIKGSFIQISGSISAGDDIKTSGGIYAGASVFNPGTGNIVSGADLIAGGGVYAGNTAGAPATGDVIGTTDGRFGGGLYVGSVAIDPASGSLIVTDTGRFGEGLYVGSTGANTVGTGSLIATAHIKTGGGLYVGNTGGSTLATGQVTYTGSLVAIRSSASYAGYTYVPFTYPWTSPSWAGTAYSSLNPTLINVSASFTQAGTGGWPPVPTDTSFIKAYNIMLSCYDSFTRTGGAFRQMWLSVGQSTLTTGSSVMARTAGSGLLGAGSDSGIVNATADGDFYVSASSSGTNTLTCTIRINGFYI